VANGGVGIPYTTLRRTVGTSDKRCGLKIVGKPCEGKPHARFDEGRLGKSVDCNSLLLYNVNGQPTEPEKGGGNDLLPFLIPFGFVGYQFDSLAYCSSMHQYWLLLN
jgi:hypothetical protein